MELAFLIIWFDSINYFSNIKIILGNNHSFLRLININKSQTVIGSIELFNSLSVVTIYKNNIFTNKFVIIELAVHLYTIYIEINRQLSITLHFIVFEISNVYLSWINIIFFAQTILLIIFPVAFINWSYMNFFLDIFYNSEPLHISI